MFGYFKSVSPKATAMENVHKKSDDGVVVLVVVVLVVVVDVV